MIGRGAVWVKREDGGCCPRRPLLLYGWADPPNPPVGAWPLGALGEALPVASGWLSPLVQVVRLSARAPVIFLAFGRGNFGSLCWSPPRRGI
jgi:hypothetical protein